MATRPEFSPTFAYLDVNLPGTGDVNKLRPNIEVRETGYDYLQKPPAEEFNWILNNIGAWLEYLDELTRDQGITTVATKQQAEDGVASDVLMTPERTLDSIKYNAVPVGNVEFSARTTAPAGYLYCNGSAVSRATYSRLFDAIGTTFGSGDGSTTFNLPDLRNEFIRGAQPGSRGVGVTESDATRSHTHTGTTASAGSHVHTSPFSNENGTDSTNYGTGSSFNRGGSTYNTSSAGAHTHTFTTNATGGSETRPQNVALLPIIKF